MAKNSLLMGAVEHGRNPEPPLRPAEIGSPPPPRDLLPLLVLTFTSLFVFAFVAFEALTFLARYRATIAAAERYAIGLTLTLAEHFEGGAEATDAALRQIVAQNKRLGGPTNDLAEWVNILNAAFAGTEAIGSLSVTDAEGIIRSSTLPQVIGQSRSDQSVFQLLRDATRSDLVVDKPFRSLRNGEIVIPIGRRLEDENKNFQGIVTATLSPAQWRDFYRTIDVGRNGMLRLMHPSGLLFYIESALDPLAEVAPEDPVLVGIGSGKPNGIVWAPLVLGGEIFVTAFRTTEPLGLVVSVSLARESILAPWLDELRWGVGAVTILIILIIAVVFQFIKHLAARRRAEGQFQLAVEASPSGMLIADGKGLIVLANAAIEKMFGYARADLLGNPVEMLVPHAARHRHIGERTAYFANPETRMMGAGRDLRGVRRDVSEFPVEIGLNPIHTREGALVLGVVVDITERRAAQEAITLLNLELEERVRRRTIELVSLNEELESFAYAVSHDLRGPIRAMDGFSQALIEDYGGKLDDDAHDFLRRIRTGSQRMGNLIDDLLKLSRVTRAELTIQRVDLAVIADQIILRLHETNPARKVETRVTPNLIVRGDPQLIEIALQNLIANAWKFTSKTDKALIELGCDRDNGLDTFFIRDNGVGFDNSYVDKLFKPFQRLHRAEEFEGTGIGLATVARVIRKHGGSIRAEASLGKGAAFYFTFEPETGDQE